MGAKLSGPGGQGGKTIEQNSEINVTPFVDVMLVLLIIFMVSAPLATVSIKLDLPPPVPSDNQEQKEPVYITIQNSGELYLAEVPTTLDGLPSDICNKLAVGSMAACVEERVFIRAQPEVKYEQFMEVMNRLQDTGYLQVGLLNEDIT